MLLVALIALAFNGWMAFNLYTSVKEEKPAEWRDYLSTVCIAGGSGAGVWISILAALKALF